MKVKTFKYNDGIVLPKIDSFISNTDIVSLAIPEVVAVPVKQCKGPEPIIMVEIGEKVKIGSILAKSRVGTVLSPVCGIVENFEKRPSCYGGICNHIIIKTDGSDDYIALPELSGELLTPSNIIKRITDLGLVDYDGIPLWQKLMVSEGEKVTELIINACTDEPFITNNDVLLTEYTVEVINGAMFLARALNVNRIKLAVTRSKFAYTTAFIDSVAEIEGDVIFEVDVVPDRYPVGDQTELVKALTKKKIKLTESPKKVGLVIVDVYSCFSVSEAVSQGLADYNKLVTVVGTGLEGKDQLTAWIRVGTTFADVLKAVRQGGNLQVVKMMAGGPMRGNAVASPDTAVTKTLKGIIFFDKDYGTLEDETMCIGCGKCVDVCPQNLMPYKIEKYVIDEDFSAAKKCRAEDCSKCGCCAFVCPAKRNLVQRITYAKSKIKETKGL